MSKIFVSIPAWEDSHLIDTMNDIIKNADDPDNIIFGLGIKYENVPNFSSFISENIKIVKDDEVGDGRPGIIGIREAIRKLITDEQYYLSIDAHAEFIPGWDTKLKNDIEELTINNSKVIISRQATAKFEGQVSRYTKWNLSGDFNNLNIQGYVVEDTDDYINKNMVNDKYFKNYYISCNFIFAKTKDILSISWPAYHKFPFEEPEQSIALFCQGYDVVSPIGGYIYHFAGNDKKYYFDPITGYDEKWWKFNGGDRSLKSNWSKIWVLDDKDMIREVCKLLILGENKYFSLFGQSRSLRFFYKTVGLLDKYDKILYDTLSKMEMYK